MEFFNNKDKKSFLSTFLHKLGLIRDSSMNDLASNLSALDRSTAIIEFTLDGIILNANYNFLLVMGYSLEEIKGKHHHIFVDPAIRNSDEYLSFWHKLKRGEFISDEFKRISKDGSERWLQASYNPILDKNGTPKKIIKFATDITERKHKSLDYQGQISAIHKSNAVIEFDVNGNILNANQNFLSLMQYSLEEVIGKHHSIFVKTSERNSEQYKAFWHNLKQGQYKSSEFERVTKDGDNVWILASYNPILDYNGKPIKVVKFATDITENKALQNKIHQTGIKLLESLNSLEVTINSQSTASLEQATAVSEIVSIVEEIKSTSQQTLEKASTLGSSAEKTYVESEKGIESCDTLYRTLQASQQKMQQIATTILGLSDKTQQIGEITEAVADIAKQSKMLALNASIEAAKAGESGKGFAVVAGEVKELAERSETATKRVQKILQDIRKTTEQAVMVSEDGTKSVDENIHQVQQTTEIISSLGDVIQASSIASQQIVSAVQEESVGINQVVQSIQEIDEVTNQFSNSTNNTKKAITELATLAEELKS